MERQMEISKYLKQENMERSTSESDPQDMKATQGKGPEATKDGTKNEAVILTRDQELTLTS